MKLLRLGLFVCLALIFLLCGVAMDAYHHGYTEAMGLSLGASIILLLIARHFIHDLEEYNG